MRLQVLADLRELPLDEPLDESQESSQRQEVRLSKCKGMRGVVVDPCATWRGTSAVKVRLALQAHLPPDSCEGGERGADDTPHTHSVLSVAAHESSECSDAVSRDPAVSHVSATAVGDASRASATRARADDVAGIVPFTSTGRNCRRSI